MKSIYIIGSLRNKEIPVIGKALREEGFDVFDDWHAAGPEADDYWQSYEKSRGRSYQEALEGYHCNHVFDFDRSHLNRVDAVLLVAPAGRSGHMELGYAIGAGKRGFILLEAEPERWDCMSRFAEKVFISVPEMKKYFNETKDK